MKPDQTFLIPKSLVKKTHGVSLDFGGTAAKFVYAHEEGEHVKLEFWTCSYENVPNALEYIKSQLQDIDLGDKLYTTGLNTPRFQQQILEKWGASTENLLEMEVYAGGLLFLLDNFPLKDIVHEDSPLVQEFLLAGVQFMKAMKTWSEKDEEDSIPTCGGEESLKFPFMMVTCGSSAGGMRVKEDRTMDVLGMTTCCGRTFMGLGSLLTGAKSYDELVAMAARGNPRNVDIFSNELLVNDNNDYAMFFSGEGSIPLFAFGHAVGKSIDDFDKDDIAAALLNHVGHQLAVSIHGWALAEKIPQVFICGGLTANSQLVRDSVAKYYAQLSQTNSQGFRSQHYFPKLGAYIPSLGSLLKTLQS